MTLTKANALGSLLLPMSAGIMLMIAWMSLYADVKSPAIFDTGLDNQLGCGGVLSGHHGIRRALLRLD